MARAIKMGGHKCSPPRDHATGHVIYHMFTKSENISNFPEKEAARKDKSSNMLCLKSK